MSITRLNVTALQRDHTTPMSSLNRPTTDTEVSESSPLGLAETFASLIPSEPFALYTAAVTVFITQIQEAEPQDQYMALRWITFGLFTAFIPAYMTIQYYRNRGDGAGDKKAANGKKMKQGTSTTRKGPWAEMISATVAFTALALIMPGSPLAAVLNASAEAVTLGLISVFAGGALLLLGTRLTKKASS